MFRMCCPDTSPRHNSPLLVLACLILELPDGLSVSPAAESPIPRPTSESLVTVCSLKMHIAQFEASGSDDVDAGCA
jgi:hypothetical protein